MHDVTATENAEAFVLTAPRTYVSVSVCPSLRDTEIRVHEPTVATILDQPFPRQITAIECGMATLQWTTPEEALDWLSVMHDRIAAALVTQPAVAA